MILARLLVDPEEVWRAFTFCVDGVPPFVSYCYTVLAPWWRLWP